jgi:hypothetical protein
MKDATGASADQPKKKEDSLTDLKAMNQKNDLMIKSPHMLKQYPIWAILILLIGMSACQPRTGKLMTARDGWTVGFYNVENLFDTIDAPGKNDADFLPNAKVAWNTERYYHKLNQIGRVIASMDTLDFPHVLGLCEVENIHVLDDLIVNPWIKKARYEIIHAESSDNRGIETAILFRPDYFKPVYHRPVQVIKDNGRQVTYRHIMYVKGIVSTRDTLHIFVNHWTSRFGGREKTQEARNFTANVLKTITDSILFAHPDASIVIVGDFNDNPEDESLSLYLGANNPQSSPVEASKLYNLAFAPRSRGEGTLYYQGWDMFDQIIVSSALLQQKKNQLNTTDMEIVAKHWMLFQGSGGVARPNRTMSGGRYFGGFSDHLPVLVRLKSSK